MTFGRQLESRLGPRNRIWNSHQRCGCLVGTSSKQSVGYCRILWNVVGEICLRQFGFPEKKATLNGQKCPTIPRHEAIKLCRKKNWNKPNHKKRHGQKPDVPPKFQLWRTLRATMALRPKDPSPALLPWNVICWKCARFQEQSSWLRSQTSNCKRRGEIPNKNTGVSWHLQHCTADTTILLLEWIAVCCNHSHSCHVNYH